MEIMANFRMGVPSRQLSALGFIVGSLTPKWSQRFLEVMQATVRDDKVKSREDISYGFAKLASSFIDLLTARHYRKVVLLGTENKVKWMRDPDAFA